MHRNHIDRDLYWDIGEVASVAYRRWCVHGTKERYLLLDELVEQSAYRAKHNASDPRLSKSRSDTERKALLKYSARLEELIPQIDWASPDESAEDLVERNETLKQIRAAAAECLREVGIEFTDEELLADG